MLRAPPDLANDKINKEDKFALGQRIKTRDPSSNNNSGSRQIKFFKKQQNAIQAENLKIL